MANFYFRAQVLSEEKINILTILNCEKTVRKKLLEHFQSQLTKFKTKVFIKKLSRTFEK